MNEIYIIKDKKKECIIGIFDKEHVKPFMDTEGDLVGDVFFPKKGFSIYGFDMNKEYVHTDVNTIKSSDKK